MTKDKDKDRVYRTISYIRQALARGARLACAAKQEEKKKKDI
jgi:hypothetical protein